MGTDDQRHTFNMSTDVLTADNVWVSINATVDYEDVDPGHTVLGSFRRGAAEAVAVWALRNDACGRSLEQALSSQAEINPVLPADMEEHAARLGVKMTRVEVTATAPSSNKPHDGINDLLRAPGFAVVLRGYDRARSTTSCSAPARRSPPTVRTFGLPSRRRYESRRCACASAVMTESRWTWS